MQSTLKLTFHGGAGRVTGANFLLEEPDGAKILVDCGMIQGGKLYEDLNREPFAYDPSSVDILFVTHGHLDHVGRIPHLIHQGFKGRIISTEPTKDIAELILLDSMGILEKESRYNNVPMPYDEDDVHSALRLWETLPYREKRELGNFTYELLDAGHILGSSMVRLVYAGKTIVFTGDLGNSPAPLLKDTESVQGANYLIMESVYGDRNHEERQERKRLLESVIEETIKKGGVLMIPAFSVERTQVLLYEINEMVENGRIPRVPMFLDSPLAIKVTKIYKKHEKLFNQGAREIIKSGDDIFRFPGLKYTLETEESKAINREKPPYIVMAGSGMSNGGRITHHEKHHLGDPNSTLLLIGYQAAGTLGRRLQDGAKKVTLHGETVDVRARIANISGYSAHKDRDGLLELVNTAADTLSQVFCVMGEPKSSLSLVQRIRDYMGIRATAPREGESVTLDV